MHKEDEEQLATLEAEARLIASQLVPEARTWAQDQGTFAKAFLLKEARLAVVNQADVTEQISGDVPALKTEIEEICNHVQASFEQWVSTIDFEEATTVAQNPRKKFLELTGEAHDAFGEAFVRRGYSTGMNSREWARETSRWAFYIPETGTARNPNMNYDDRTGEELSKLMNSLTTISQQIRTLKEQIQRSRAARVWDSV